MNVTYEDFPTLIPSLSNRVVGGVLTNGNLYCRPCIERLGLDWNNMKYITDSRAKKYIYNCIECGRQITKKRSLGLI